LCIGLAEDANPDFHSIPYSRWRGTKSSGAEINATTYLNLIRHDWLERTSVATELALVLLVGGMFGYVLGLARPMRAAGLGVLGSIGIGVIANVTIWKTHVWFPWLIISGVQIPPV
jgi:CHASE2 domain-containing sensor protein